MSKPIMYVLCSVCPLLIPANHVRAGEPKTADDVIAKHLEALGGLKNIEAVKTMRMAGKSIMQGGLEIVTVIEIKRPNKIRSEITFQGMTGVQAFDGETGWFIQPFSGRTDPEKLPPELAEIMAEQADFEGPLVNYKKKGHQVEFMGKDDEDGSESYKLKVTKKNGDTEYHFLDTDAFMTVKSKGKRSIQGTEIEFEVIPGGYKEIGGIMVPHSITTSSGPMGSATVTFDKIEVNVDMPDDRFTMPKVEKPVTDETKKEDTSKEEDRPEAKEPEPKKDEPKKDEPKKEKQ